MKITHQFVGDTMGEDCSLHEQTGDFQAWRHVLYDVYKPQRSTVLDLHHRQGRIRQWQFGVTEVSNYECGAMRFLREPKHVGPGCEDHYFVSMPCLAGCAMELTQEGRTARCTPGAMIVQHTARPSELTHPTVGALIVRVAGPALRSRFRNTLDRLGVALPCARSTGALFSALATALVDNAPHLDAEVRRAAGERLIDLLAISLEAKAGDLPRSDQAVRAGHRARALRTIRETFRDPNVSPVSVAAACGISVRYLHELFRDQENSVHETVMEARLLHARQLLRARLGVPKSVSEVAYACGFSDAAHFSRRFSRRFGASPRAFLGTQGPDSPEF